LTIGFTPKGFGTFTYIATFLEQLDNFSTFNFLNSEEIKALFRSQTSFGTRNEPFFLSFNRQTCRRRRQIGGSDPQSSPPNYGPIEHRHDPSYDNASHQRHVHSPFFLQSPQP